MSVDLLSLLILAVYMAIGAWRGALASALGMFTLVAAYGASVLAGAKLGDVAATRLGMAPLLGSVLVGVVAFGATLLVLGIASRLLLSHDRWALGDEPLSPLERFGGALLGALRGAVVVLLVGWLAAGWTGWQVPPPSPCFRASVLPSRHDWPRAWWRWERAQPSTKGLPGAVSPCSCLPIRGTASGG